MTETLPAVKQLKQFFSAYRSFIAFCLIGVLNTLVYAGLMISFVEGIFIRPTVAAGLAFVLANVFSYLMNSHFTFRQRPVGSAYVRFLTVSLFNLLATLCITFLCELYGVHYLIGLVGVIFTSTVLTFLLHKRFSFS